MTSVFVDVCIIHVTEILKVGKCKHGLGRKWKLNWILGNEWDLKRENREDDRKMELMSNYTSHSYL